jgi:uncharacterized membrane protein
MAGIGFQLTTLLAKRTLAAGLHAYGVAALRGSGSWMLSMARLPCLVRPRIGNAGELDLFFVAVTPSFACSLISTRPSQVRFSRSTADCVFAKQDEKIFPFLLGALAVNALLGLIFSVGFVPADAGAVVAGLLENRALHCREYGTFASQPV